ncbi:hypothetical protein CDAR_416231 [Caerostris darwini]|uniref:Uncharacterized protein n=1 Tax=Caerostris darwini TaxID=1538125 RepID=A0AAV4W5Z3_9ARAC|nr:hypothetical protein CDAR_416231 [Caerostris darwini]
MADDNLFSCATRLNSNSFLIGVLGKEWVGILTAYSNFSDSKLRTTFIRGWLVTAHLHQLGWFYSAAPPFPPSKDSAPLNQTPRLFCGVTDNTTNFARALKKEGGRKRHPIPVIPWVRWIPLSVLPPAGAQVGRQAPAEHLQKQSSSSLVEDSLA